jgi:hypothetical protein
VDLREVFFLFSLPAQRDEKEPEDRRRFSTEVKNEPIKHFSVHKKEVSNIQNAANQFPPSSQFDIKRWLSVWP